jgi:sucrose-6-phosphate hydrolase SacC (GH32 family)
VKNNPMNSHRFWDARSLTIALAKLLIASVCAATANTEKTLVSWITLDNLTQQGGSALTIQRGDKFDAIVFGEKEPGRWMAGSENFDRTQAEQGANLTERANGVVQVAVVYKSGGIEIYRNGARYAAYEAKNVDLLTSQANLAVFGLRHLGAESGQTFRGTIEEARIYDEALTLDQIKDLVLNQPSAVKPYAWWTFEKGQETDRIGRFPVNCLTGGARIENGHLVLDKAGATLVAVKALPSAKVLAAAEGGAESLEAYRTFRQRLQEDRTRPLYHLVAPEGRAWPADPNGAIYWKGRYHLHFIFGRDWAHLSSVDMVHWRWHPPTRLGSGGMNSGGCFLNKEGIPTIIYNDYGVQKNQLASAADDDLEQWSTAWPIEPTVRPGQDGKLISTWDPDAWFEGDTYYALFGGHPYEIKPATLMKSRDLRHWEYVGPFMTREMPDVERSSDSKVNEDISCPNFFKIGNKYMLLCISHLKGCRYYLGEWKDEKFTPEFHARMNWSRAEGQAPGTHGGDFFAPESLETPDGRRVMWAWCLGGGNTLWDGIQSLPRELSLPEDGVLRIKPLRELEQLRYYPMTEPGVTVRDGQTHRLNGIAGDALEILLRFQKSGAKRYGVKLHASPDNTRGIDLVVDPSARTIQLGATTAPFDLPPQEDLQLRIFIDRRIVEVFANDRQAVFKQHAYEPNETGVCLFSEGGNTDVTEIKAWRMAASNPW